MVVSSHNNNNNDYYSTTTTNTTTTMAGPPEDIIIDDGEEVPGGDQQAEHDCPMTIAELSHYLSRYSLDKPGPVRPTKDNNDIHAVFLRSLMTTSPSSTSASSSSISTNGRDERSGMSQADWNDRRAMVMEALRAARKARGAFDGNGGAREGKDTKGAVVGGSCAVEYLSKRACVKKSVRMRRRAR